MVYIHGCMLACSLDNDATEKGNGDTSRLGRRSAYSSTIASSNTMTYMRTLMRFYYDSRTEMSNALPWHQKRVDTLPMDSVLNKPYNSSVKFAVPSWSSPDSLAVTPHSTWSMFEFADAEL